MVRARVRNRVGKGFLSKDKGMIRNSTQNGHDQNFFLVLILPPTSITSHCIENTIPTEPMIKHKRSDFYDWKLQIYTLFWYSIYVFTKKKKDASLSPALVEMETWLQKHPYRISRGTGHDLQLSRLVGYVHTRVNGRSSVLRDGGWHIWWLNSLYGMVCRSEKTIISFAIVIHHEKNE